MSEHSILLLRHGQTEWSATGKHTSHTDVPLTGVGERQAHAAGRTYAVLHGGTAPALVLCSPRVRAQDTARLAGIDVDETCDELAEWDYGEYEGITTEQIHRNVPDWTLWTDGAPNGETPAQVAARADRVLERARKTLTDGDVVLIGHGHFSRVLIARWLGLDAALGEGFRVDPASISALGYDRGAPQIRHLNVPPT
ncbi:putative phosphoglycerate mutase [Prauserella sediminis]|uniref:Putative phosphoglycerate mutase n=1 Tax=Prauserella sediminis TaxID=577680 RepID=A0A839XR62_9PSEU|nr:histidine phosphatase family protein [Prauserella sediminis]MBB3663934.1 putative phosphoglycerate mutase [Prauserella sediminis]